MWANHLEQDISTSWTSCRFLSSGEETLGKTSPNEGKKMGGIIDKKLTRGQKVDERPIVAAFSKVCVLPLGSVFKGPGFFCCRVRAFQSGMTAEGSELAKSKTCTRRIISITWVAAIGPQTRKAPSAARRAHGVRLYLCNGCKVRQRYNLKASMRGVFR